MDRKYIPPVFRWERCYEDDAGIVHWALCDTISDKHYAPMRVISCAHLVLLARAQNCGDGRPLSDQNLPKLIVKLLNEYFEKPADKLNLL